MPTYDSCLICNSKSNRTIIFISSVTFICVGLAVMFLLNRSSKPIGESLTDHPIKLFGIILVVIGCMFSVMMCVRCLITKNPPASSSPRAILTNDSMDSQNSPGWSVMDVGRQFPVATYSSNSFYFIRTPSHDAPRPIEYDPPPTYKEVMESLNPPGYPK